jgi:hypothetical protein
MKHQLYKYHQNGVSLEFSFAEDEKLLANKKVFLELLKQATEDLEKEIIS